MTTTEKLEFAESYETSLLNILESAKNRIKKTKSKSLKQVYQNRIKILSPKVKKVQLFIKQSKT